MKPIRRFSELSSSRKALVRLCQDLNFGTILNVRIVNGEVSFDPPPEVIVDLRLDEEVSVRAESELGDFNLCAAVCRLLAQIDALNNGTIEKILVYAGLPRRVLLRSSLTPAAGLP